MLTFMNRNRRGWRAGNLSRRNAPDSGTTVSVAGAFTAGALFGAAMMYVLDPNMGRRRRAMARDQIVHAQHEVGDLGAAAQGRAKDLKNRAQGTLVEARGALTPAR